MTASDAQYHWKFAPYDVSRADTLAEKSGIPPLLAHLLGMRGLETADSVRDFLHPLLQHLSDPFELEDMSAAVDRITRAREQKEAVLVFGDYDVDGISATAILTRGLRRFGIHRVGYDMPDRFSDGYGLMAARVEQAKEEGYTLLITVDNGISAHEAADRARDLGIDLIITDHHTVEGPVPNAVAVVNPKRGSYDHPAAFLAGAGVAFKLAFALNGSPNDLDLVALGTVSDIVPLLQENRVLVALGLKHFKKYKRLGIDKLARISRFRLEEISAHKIGFQLGPRLNAAGRLDSGHAALDLLMLENREEDEAQAIKLAKTLDTVNEERRAIERDIFDQAVESLDAFITEEQRSIVLAGEEWHQGVIGIVASRVQNKYYRPAVVFSMGEDGYWRGSARSGPDFDMMAALTACADLLLRYGGHVAAAGMTLAPENMDSFRERFEVEALRQLGTGKLQPTMNVDALVAFTQLDDAFVRGLEQLEPYGQRNPEPVFSAVGVEVVPQSLRILQEKHMKFSVRQGGTQLSVIAFRMAERFYKESLPTKIDIVFTPQLNTYNNNTEVQLVLKDLCLAKD